MTTLTNYPISTALPSLLLLAATVVLGPISCATSKAPTAQVPRFERDKTALIEARAENELKELATKLSVAFGEKGTKSDRETLHNRLNAYTLEHADDANGWALLGQYYEYSDDRPYALEAYKKAYELKPEVVPFGVMYGKALLANNDAKTSVQVLEKTAELESIEPAERNELLKQVAYIYLGLQETGKAIDAAKRLEGYAQTPEEVYSSAQFTETVYTTAGDWENATKKADEIQEFWESSTGDLKGSGDFVVATDGDGTNEYLLAKVHQPATDVAAQSKPTYWRIYWAKQEGEQLVPQGIYEIGTAKEKSKQTVVRFREPEGKDAKELKVAKGSKDSSKEVVFAKILPKKIDQVTIEKVVLLMRAIGKSNH